LVPLSLHSFLHDALPISLPVFVIAVILATPVARNRARGQLPLLALAVVGFIYFGWMFAHLAFLANSTHAYSYLGYLVAAVELNEDRKSTRLNSSHVSISY